MQSTTEHIPDTVVEPAWRTRRRESNPFQPLLRRSVLGLAGCACMVVLAYYFVDRPVAIFVHQHHLNQFAIFGWLTHLAMVFNALAPIVVVAACVRLAWGPLTRLEWTLFAASVSLIVAVALEYYLKFLFGRYWPETWVDNNPSLIGSGAYGLHPFHFGEAYGSFPSGHTARVVAVLGTIALAYPRWRCLCVLGSAAVVVGLVAMNYHFVGDTIGGAFLGSLTAMYTARFFKVDFRCPQHGALG